mmetsp:Transcript_7152/g.12870  ORF Transcript_7152/g.12870 Transcript_7152/m.12870 type:complete len:475 (-) Transcript_7152:2032-3456(-)
MKPARASKQHTFDIISHLRNRELSGSQHQQNARDGSPQFDPFYSYLTHSQFHSSSPSCPYSPHSILQPHPSQFQLNHPQLPPISTLSHLSFEPTPNPHLLAATSSQSHLEIHDTELLRTVSFLNNAHHSASPHSLLLKWNAGVHESSNRHAFPTVSCMQWRPNMNSHPNQITFGFSSNKCRAVIGDVTTIDIERCGSDYKALGCFSEQLKVEKSTKCVSDLKYCGENVVAVCAESPTLQLVDHRVKREIGNVWKFGRKAGRSVVVGGEGGGWMLVGVEGGGIELVDSRVVGGEGGVASVSVREECGRFHDVEWMEHVFESVVVVRERSGRVGVVDVEMGTVEMLPKTEESADRTHCGGSLGGIECGMFGTEHELNRRLEFERLSRRVHKRVACVLHKSAAYRSCQVLVPSLMNADVHVVSMNSLQVKTQTGLKLEMDSLVTAIHLHPTRQLLAIGYATGALQLHAPPLPKNGPM